MTTEKAAMTLASMYQSQRDELLRRAARIVERAHGRELSDPEAVAVEMLFSEAGTLDGRVERLGRVAGLAP